MRPYKKQRFFVIKFITLTGLVFINLLKFTLCIFSNPVVFIPLHRVGHLAIWVSSMRRSLQGIFHKLNLW